jgi:hypothetical protein
MTDDPTNRIGRPSGGGAGSDDALTQRAYQQNPSATPPTSKIRSSNGPGQVSPQAWSQATGEPGYYRESGGYYPEAQQPSWDAAPDVYSASQPDAGELSRKARFRSAPTYLVAAAAVAVLTAGGGLAYTLTSSDHPAPAHPSVQPAPQQSNDAPPALQAPPPAQDQPPAPAPDAPISAPDNSSGSAPNVVPAPALAPAPVVVPAPAPQQQTDPDPPLPNNQQQPDPNQFPNNQQFPNDQQHPGHHHPPNNQQNQNQQNQNPQNPQNPQHQNQQNQQNQNQNQNQNQQNQQQNQNQNPKQNQQNQQPQNQQQKPESANDTLCHPKPPPC